MIDGQAIGLATYFPTFSTYLAKPGIWLDDLYVREGYRSRGVGKALLAALARTAKGLNCGRIEWTVASNNDRGIAFYGATARRYSTTSDAFDWKPMGSSDSRRNSDRPRPQSCSAVKVGDRE